MKKFLLLPMLVIGVISVLSAPAFALLPDPPTVPPPAPDPIAQVPYQVNITALPHATASSSKITAALTIVFGVIGALSLMMVTIGGFRYVASQGDPQAVTKAKDTIIYALVGVVVSISAVAIVTFVIGRT